MKKLATKDIWFVSIQFVLFILYFIPLFSFTFNLSVFLKYTGRVLTVIGFLVIFIAIFQLNRNLTPFPTPVNKGTLIKTGLYKFIRHPIYSGIILAAIGFGLYNESLWKLSIGLVLWILFYFKSRYEETLLLKRYPDYESYCIRTGRFFPFI